MSMHSVCPPCDRTASRSTVATTAFWCGLASLGRTTGAVRPTSPALSACNGGHCAMLILPFLGFAKASGAVPATTSAIAHDARRAIVRKIGVRATDWRIRNLLGRTGTCAATCFPWIFGCLDDGIHDVPLIRSTRRAGRGHTGTACPDAFRAWQARPREMPRVTVTKSHFRLQIVISSKICHVIP